MYNIILIGSQGSGKGTQAETLVDTYNLHYVEMGRLIRQRAQAHDKKGLIIDHIANKQGILLPDGIIMDMIYDELEEHSSDNGYLFDGFPRTTKQYDLLKELFKKKHMRLTHAFYIQISDEIAHKRLSLRYVCNTCHKSYTIENNQSLICPCGGNLTRRKDDTIEAIQKRLTLYHARTQPVLKAINTDNLLITINGEQSVKKVAAHIQSYL